MKMKLPQQSLNLLRLFLTQPGWAKTTKDIYIGGRLLVEVLPECDLSWMKSEAQLKAMSPDDLSIYRAVDHAWCAVEVEFELTEVEKETCRKMLERVTETGSIGAGKWVFRLFDAFGFRP